MATHRHELVPFKAWMIRGLHWAESEYMELMGSQAAAIYERHPSWAGYCDGRFVGAGGIVVPYRGLGEGWAIAGPLVVHHRLWFHQTIKRCIVSFEQALELRRHQVMVRDSFTVSHKWVVSLGFKYETTLARYGIKGEDMRVYVRLPGVL